MPLDDRLAWASVCYLETIGRVSGEKREIEIWFAANGDRVYLLSGGRDEAHWVRNLQRNPRVRIRIRSETFEGTARVIEGDADDPLARRLLAAKYQGWQEGQPLSTWARESLPVAIDLQLQTPLRDRTDLSR